jgi:hypothetical protein
MELQNKVHVTFKGTYPIQADPNISPNDYVHMIACEIWQMTGYRFM